MQHLIIMNLQQKNLLESDYSISGLSVYSAKNFWEKLGAEFKDNLYHFSLKS